MRNLWAPWRIEYVLGKREPYCIFCAEGGGKSDDERLLLWRRERTMVLMNKYPYNNGHLLIAPWRHVSDVTALDEVEMCEIMTTIARCIEVLRTVMRPEGFNVGLNLGAVAGAGIEEHLHFHVVPRWSGDTNFIAVVGELRTIPEHFRQTYEKLLPHFKEG